MTKSDQPQNFKTALGFLVLFAATGQFFMAQADKPYTLWIGLFFYGLALWELKTFALAPLSQPKPISPRLEAILFILILGLACFLRLYQIDSLPAGMHTDQGLTGLCALRIEHEGWRPFNEIFNFQVPEVLLFYQLALWFKTVGDSLFNFHLFFTFQALAALAFFYGTFRQLSSPKTALLSLFILSVMRWNWIETRTGYPSSEVLFYLFGTLCFWIYGLKKQKIGAFILSAVLMGLGLYTYQAFKLVPFLFLIYAAAEYFWRRKENPIRFSAVTAYLLIVFLLALPLLSFFWNQKTLGNRERDVFIGTQIMEQKSLKPLLDIASGNALMFNRAGDEIARHNIPGHRMLDDVTGVLFILGLALAFRRWKNRDSFYALSGFFALALAGFLSNQPNNSNRLVVLTAFVAFFAGSFLEFLWDRFKHKTALSKNILVFFIALLLAAITFQNFYTYFVTQANNEDCHLSLGLEQATIGQAISELQKENPNNFHYFITPLYAENHVVHFLGYSGWAYSSPLNLTALAQGDFPKDKTAVFFLDQNKKGVFEFLKTIFPKGHETLLQNSEGHVLLYRYDVSAEDLSHFKKWGRGLSGTYWNSLNKTDQPILRRQDPLLNFTSKRDFPFENYPPFSIQWKAQLIMATSGTYQIHLLTTDKAAIWVDGREIFNSGKSLEKPVYFKKGSHSLRIDYQKTDGDSMMLHLVWTTPLQPQWEVVPATAFGK